jgi:ribose transport system substrate-binding protein
VGQQSGTPYARLRRKRRTGFRRSAALAAVAVVTLVLGACSSSGSTKAAGSGGHGNAPPVRTVNFGAGNIKVGGKPLKIALLTACKCNAYEVAYNGGAMAEAKRLGVSLTLFDSNLNPSTQIEQAKLSVTQGYNAWVLTALSPDFCTLVKQEVKKGILISVNNQHVCTSVYATGNSIWVPGTVNFAGGDQTADIFNKFVQQIAQDNPGPQQVALVEGTPDLTQSLLVSRAASQVEQSDPQFHVSFIQVPTYDFNGANTAVKTFLPAHPKLTILATVYSDMTQGAAQALKQAGRHVKVYDMGGSKWAFGAVRSGLIQSTSLFLPATEGKLAVDSLYQAWTTGKPGPHYVSVLAGKPDPFVTKQTIGNLQAQY